MATKDIVFMKNGDDGKSATQAPGKTFESYWSKKGFVEITAEEATELNKPAVVTEDGETDGSDQSHPAGDPPDYSGLTRSELNDLATAKGLDPSAFSNRDEIISALSS